MDENLKRNNKGNLVTCGIILMDYKGNILAGHTTGKKWKEKGTYDILKGCSEVGEEDIETAIRELKEESSFDVSKYKHKIKDIGIFDYIKGKDIHLFLLKLKYLPNISKLKCDSFFEHNGKQLPEINEYRIIGNNERDYFSNSIQKVLKKINL